MSEHFSKLTRAAAQVAGGPVTHRESISIVERSHGLPVWENVVEVFDVDHSPPQQVYAWAVVAGDSAEYVAVVGDPATHSPVSAVQSWLRSHRHKRTARVPGRPAQRNEGSRSANSAEALKKRTAALCRATEQEAVETRALHLKLVTLRQNFEGELARSRREGRNPVAATPPKRVRAPKPAAPAKESAWLRKIKRAFRALAPTAVRSIVER